MVRRDSLFACLMAGLVLATSGWADDVPLSPTAKRPSKPAAAAVQATVANPAAAQAAATPAAAVQAAATPAAAPAPLSRQRRQRRQQWEQALQSPAELTVGDQKSITLGKLLDQIREKHSLNVQIDMPHVLPMLPRLMDSGSGYSGGGLTAGLTGFLPFGFQSIHRCEPALPGVYCPTCPSQAPVWGSVNLAPACALPPGSPPESAAPAYAAPAAPRFDGEYPNFVRPPEAPAAPPASAVGPSAAAAAVAPSAAPTAAVSAPVAAAGMPVAPLPKALVNKGAPAVAAAASNGVTKVSALDDGPPSELSEETPQAKPGPATKEAEASNELGQAISAALKSILETPVDAAVVTRPNATVEDVLRQALDQALPMQALLNSSMSSEMPMVASLTKAAEWDLLVQDNGVLVTTRLNANLQKETRVYSLRALEQSNLKPEDVARVVTRTVRPWSWKKYFPDAASEATAAAPATQKSKGAKKVSLPKVNLDLLSLLLSANVPAASSQRIRLTSDDEVTVVPPTATASGDAEKVELTEEDLELLGRAWDGLFQATVTSLQVIYHSDPPTGVVEVLPGMLIISQSQGAHREIADLLEQLAHPEN